MARNRLTGRVTLHPVAAPAPRNRVTRSRACGSSSGAVIDRGAGAGKTLEVKMVDWFGHLDRSRPIDLLKMDIEGGEYELLSDPRFADLAAGAIVMEWHTVPGTEYRAQWCVERLGSLNYRVHSECEPHAGGAIGMLWAVRRDL